MSYNTNRSIATKETAAGRRAGCHLFWEAPPPPCCAPQTGDTGSHASNKGTLTPEHSPHKDSEDVACLLLSWPDTHKVKHAVPQRRPPSAAWIRVTLNPGRLIPAPPRVQSRWRPVGSSVVASHHSEFSPFVCKHLVSVTVFAVYNLRNVLVFVHVWITFNFVKHRH